MENITELVEQSRSAFRREFQAEPLLVSVAPGRINIIGEHTDYNHGLAMPSAINRWICVCMRPRKDRKIILKSHNYNSLISFNVGESYQPTKDWERYVVGGVSIFNENYSIYKGFEASISGNVPIGSGLSSSAALEVAFVNALKSSYNVSMNVLDLIKICQKIEHEFLNIQSGLLDQFASCFSREGNFLVVDFSSLDFRYFKANMDDWTWVVVDSRVKRELSEGKYTERVRECREGLKYLQLSGISITNLGEITRIDLSIISSIPSEVLLKRLRHLVSENRRVLAAEESLKKGNFTTVGEILVQSHSSLRDDYEVSCDELDYLVDIAIRHEDCVGSRMTGAGFGGCTINLVKSSGVKDFINYVIRRYQKHFDIQPQAFEVKLVDGAKIFS